MQALPELESPTENVLPNIQSIGAIGARMAGFLQIQTPATQKSSRKRVVLEAGEIDDAPVLGTESDNPEPPKQKRAKRECYYQSCKSGRKPAARIINGVLVEYDNLETIWKAGLKANVKRYCNVHVLEEDPPHVQDLDL